MMPDPNRQERHPKLIILMQRITIVIGFASAIIGFFNHYLLAPLKVIYHHFFNSGGENST